jgi:hypothetical protein
MLTSGSFDLQEFDTMADESPQTRQQQQARELEQQANQSQRGLVGEFTDFLLHNKKWWLTPIVLVLLLVGVLIAVGGTGAAPFIYTLF